MSLRIQQADFANPDHGAAIVRLLDAYARDPMGGGKPLSDSVKCDLVPALARIPGALTLLAYVDEHAVGLANCFAGFSTFACRPLLNIHDIAVLPAYRGQGVAGAMLAEIEAIARARGCCKVTLEVLENNHAAQSAYRKYGFAGYELRPEAGRALFWEKSL
ncbi:GNAT family N-acetyltransferase [Magnetofaba australis]|nr:GNAT family N-acetyltransferase [Magnetofaba australis]